MYLCEARLLQLGVFILVFVVEVVVGYNSFIHKTQL